MVLDELRGRVTRAVALCDQPCVVAVNPDLDRVYATYAGWNTLDVVDGATAAAGGGIVVRGPVLPG